MKILIFIVGVIIIVFLLFLLLYLILSGLKNIENSNMKIEKNVMKFSIAPNMIILTVFLILSFVISPLLLKKTPQLSKNEINNSGKNEEKNNSKINDNNIIILTVDSAKKILSKVTIVANAAEIDSKNENDLSNTKVTDVNGKVYKLSDVSEKKLLLPYEDNGYEVFFYGQVDNKGRWNGPCLINTYQERKLVFVNSVIYNSGEQKKYSQFYADENTWKYLNRETVLAKSVYNSETDKYGNTYVNIGETWTYKKNNEVTQKISFKNPKTEDLVYPEELRNKLGISLSSYYNGITSGNKKINSSFCGANDYTNKAFFIKYFDDGTINVIYQGQFVNGTFNDETGNAWEIACNADKNKPADYMYEKGIFTDGKFDVGRNSTNKNMKYEAELSVTRINELIKNTPFDEMDLPWNNKYLGVNN